MNPAASGDRAAAASSSSAYDEEDETTLRERMSVYGTVVSLLIEKEGEDEQKREE